MFKSFKVIALIVSCYSWLSAQQYDGFYKFSYDETSGKMLLEVPVLKADFLMVNAFGTGVGSNDIGIDRGKLQDVRIVRFEKHGDKILLVQPNLDYRAISENVSEVRAVEEAFAKSVIYGAKIEKKEGSTYFIDIAPLLLEDLNQVAFQLRESKQGTYKLDKQKSALFFDNIHAFPENVEFESVLTFTGEPAGNWIKGVTPSPEYVSLRQHVSFIKLPDNQYAPRVFHPECGYFYISYFDYATPVYSPIEKKFIRRHRLVKKNPLAKVSDPVEPIIYYLDPGCPEPIKSALMEGGKWWAQAFEAAGFSNAFDIRVLPEGAHPLDVRYNMIQWVHRSTRGWSYGSSITDPRTGEIIKGHVSLGSLRVRQDFMIAQGIASPYEKNDENHKLLMDMSLNRLKQLSAHEIGHTLGLAHNFAASVNDRASVMDYPHPLVMENVEGMPDFSNVYDDKIGIWDKRAIMYGYMPVENGKTESDLLKNLIEENQRLGLLYLTDEDARGAGSASTVNHLWDNGKNPEDELDRLLILRNNAIGRFGMSTIPAGTPLSELEKIFVPLYFMHRYQVEAVSKVIGGVDYTYAVKGFGKPAKLEPVTWERQKNASLKLLNMFSESTLGIPGHVSEILFPPASGFKRSRESFATNTSPTFDEQAAIESAAGQIIDLMLQPERLGRLLNQNHLENYFDLLSSQLCSGRYRDKVRKTAEILYVSRLKSLSVADNSSHALRAHTSYAIDRFSAIKQKSLAAAFDKGEQDVVHESYIRFILSMSAQEVKESKMPSAPPLPPGAPIGSCSADE